MKKGILITIIGIIIIGIGYFGIQIYGFAKGVKEDAQKEKINVESKNQNLPITYPTSNKVNFSIRADKKYDYGKPIEITLVWENESVSNEKIMIRDYWQHPIGVSASITDLANNERLEKYATTHVLSSQLYVGKDLTDYEMTLKPNEEKKYKVDLRQIPYFDNDELDRTKNIPKGRYSARITYYLKLSNKIEFEIK